MYDWEPVTRSDALVTSSFLLLLVRHLLLVAMHLLLDPQHISTAVSQIPVVSKLNDEISLQGLCPLVFCECISGCVFCGCSSMNRMVPRYEGGGHR